MVLIVDAVNIVNLVLQIAGLIVQINLNRSKTSIELIDHNSSNRKMFAPVTQA